MITITDVLTYKQHFNVAADSNVLYFNSSYVLHIVTHKKKPVAIIMVVS